MPIVLTPTSSAGVGALTLLQLVNRLKRESARSGAQLQSVATASGDDLRLVDWIASAWLELQNETDWRWKRKPVTAAIASGVSRYTVVTLGIVDFARWVEPSTFEKPIVTSVAAPTIRGRLEYRSRERFLTEAALYDTRPGMPQTWAVDIDNSLLIGPVPEGDWTLTHEYWADVTRLADDDDTPDMPARWHELLVWRALMEVAGFDAAPEIYSRAKANYDRMHSDLWGAEGPKMQQMTGRRLY